MNKAQIAKLANPVIAALVAAEQSQVKVGDAVISAASKLDKSSIKPFCDAIRASLEKRGFTPASVKVTTMYIRRVITAIVVDGMEVEPGQSLRGIYQSLPKKQTGGASHAPRLPNPAKAGKPDTSAPAADTATSEAEKFRNAVELLFGSYDAELIAAVQYAASNKGIFIKWAQASAQAAALAAEKPATKRVRKAVPA